MQRFREIVAARRADIGRSDHSSPGSL